MTEVEWLASADPVAMLVEINDRPRVGHDRLHWSSARKLRLFACACCRQVLDGTECQDCDSWSWYWTAKCPELAWKEECGSCHGTGLVGGLADPRSRRAVEVAERYADALATEEERRSALASLENPGSPGWLPEHRIAGHCVFPDGWQQWIPLTEELNALGWLNHVAQAALIRDIFGNPFRPVRLPTTWKPSPGTWNDAFVRRKQYESCPWLRWNDGTVLKIAQGIYREKTWNDMPVLADALIDSGCDDEDLIRHCQEGGPHVLGCHAIDILIGKC